MNVSKDQMKGLYRHLNHWNLRFRKATSQWSKCPWSKTFFIEHQREVQTYDFLNVNLKVRGVWGSSSSSPTHRVCQLRIVSVLSCEMLWYAYSRWWAQDLHILVRILSRVIIRTWVFYKPDLTWDCEEWSIDSLGVEGIKPRSPRHKSRSSMLG